MTNTDIAQDTPNVQVSSDRSIALRQASQILTGDRGLKLSNYEEMYRFAKAVAQSKFKPVLDWTEVDCFICLQKGAEVGMSPMQSLESIYVVNNRATLFGDAPKGLVEASGLLADYDQYEEGKPFEDDYKYVVMSHRKNRSKPIITTYSVADAKTAGLWEKRGKDGKPSAWVTAPKRMLLMRARGFNLRDNFPDVLKGFTVGELIDEEGLAGFEHAKAASGKVVEPNFGPQQTAQTAASSQTSDSVPRETMEQLPKRPRGRPPKNPVNQPVPAPPATEPQPEEPDKESGESEPEPAVAKTEQPQTAPAQAPGTRQTSFFGPAIAREQTRADEVRKRLLEAREPEEKFMRLMHAFGYVTCGLNEIAEGQITIKDLEQKDIELALRNWPMVIKELASI